jgi:beta-lactamase class D
VTRLARAVLGLLLALPGTALGQAGTERPDWARPFADAGVRGTIVVADERGGRDSTWVHGEARARTRFIPASTFKIPHALFALDAGVVRDEFQVFESDGVPREIKSWIRDQDLRS